MITVFEQRTIPLPFEKVLPLFDALKASENHPSTDSNVKEAQEDVSEQWKIYGTRFEIKFIVRHDAIVVVFATPPGYRVRICGIYDTASSNLKTNFEPSAKPTWILGTELPSRLASSTVETRSVSVSSSDKSMRVTPIAVFSEAVKKSSRNAFSRLAISNQNTCFLPLIGSMEARFTSSAQRPALC